MQRSNAQLLGNSTSCALRWQLGDFQSDAMLGGGGGCLITSVALMYEGHLDRFAGRSLDLLS